MQRNNWHTWTVSKARTLERCIADRLAGVSLTGARVLIERGHVKINDTTVTLPCRVQKQAHIQVQLPNFLPHELPVPNKSLSLTVRFKTDDLLVIQKQAPLPCFPAFGGDAHALVCALVARYPMQREIGRKRSECGLLHRLDNETSGLLLAARTQKVFNMLLKQQQAGSIHKQYLALVHGTLKHSGTVSLPIAHAARKPQKMVAVRSKSLARKRNARAATTHFQTIQSNKQFSLVKVLIVKGARHQVRVHLAAIGHPIVGDKLYAGDHVHLPDRHFLHASGICFVDPSSKKIRNISCKLPKDLQSCLGKLLAQLEF